VRAAAKKSFQPHLHPPMADWFTFAMWNNEKRNSYTIMIPLTKKEKPKTRKALLHAELMPWMEDNKDSKALGYFEWDFLWKWLAEELPTLEIANQNGVSKTHVETRIRNAIGKIRRAKALEEKLETIILDAEAKNGTAFNYPVREVMQNPDGDEEQAVLLLKRPLTSFGLTRRVEDVFVRIDLLCLGHVLEESKMELLKWRNFGKLSLAELDETIMKMGLKWRSTK